MLVGRDDELETLRAALATTETVLRLLGAVGGLAVLEDLHWAGADTLAVVEYLANNIVDVPCVLVATLRAEEATAAAVLARSLARTGSVSVMRFEPPGRGGHDVHGCRVPAAG